MNYKMADFAMNRPDDNLFNDIHLIVMKNYSVLLCFDYS